MNAFCPFSKETCRGSECVMYRDEECLIVSFLQSTSEGISPSVEITEPSGIEIHRPEAEVPDEIKSATPEELAAELISFVKKELSGEERMWVRKVSRLFWGGKGVERWLMPPDVRLRMEKAEMLAQKELDTEQKVKEREQLEKEKAGLPSLVNLCVDWAIERGLKRVTQADVQAFLMEKNVEVLRQTERSLYALANVKLRSKR